MCDAPAGITGFTLIEMLVVLLILGLFAGMVGAMARPNERALLEVEAERLAHLLNLAAEKSRASGKAIGWTSDGPGYRFWHYRQDTGWSEIGDDDLLRPRALREGMTIEGLRAQATQQRGAMRLEFIPYGPTPAFAVDMSFGSARYTVVTAPLREARAVPAGGESNGKMAPR
jgi:general secretion pathway protein H